MASHAARNTSSARRTRASEAGRRHTLRIESLESRLTMSADLANTIGAARVFATGATFAGRIGDGVLGSRDVDIVGFTVQSGGRLTVDIDARTLPGGSTLDSYLRVFTRSGATVASNDDIGDARDSWLSFTVPSAGTYFVGVSGWGNAAYNPLRAAGGTAGSTGAYSLTVTVTNPQPADRAGDTLATAANLGTLAGSLAVQDTIGGADRGDVYRFVVSQRSRVGLRLDGMSSDADLQLLDAGGARLAASDAAGTTADVIERELEPGTYHARVTPYAGTTSYRLGFSATAVTAPAPSYRATTGWGFVDAAAAVAKVRGSVTPFPAVANLGGNEVGNDLVNAPEVWARGYTGAGVVVAVVDTGVDYNHPDLRQNIWVNPREIAGDGIDNDRNGFVDDVRGWDFVGNDAAPMDVVDTSRDWLGNRGNSGHGTHVAGTIAAARNGIGSTGVAPDARIMPVRVLDHRGNGDDAIIARGVRYAADNGAHVINMSLGGGSPSADVEQAIRHAVSRGCVVVIAAGNDGEATPMFPAHLAATIDGVIAVGATNGDRTLAHFSHRAGSDQRMQYVVAPGVGIHSTLPGGGYGPNTGTSMAAPHVAGVVALMRSALPAGSRQRYWTHVTGTARQTAAAAGAQTTAASVTVTAAGRLAAFAAMAADPGLLAGQRTPSRVAFAARA